jgi:hypothetical protein
LQAVNAVIAHSSSRAKRLWSETPMPFDPAASIIPSFADLQISRTAVFAIMQMRLLRFRNDDNSPIPQLIPADVALGGPLVHAWSVLMG